MSFGLYVHIPYCLQRCSYCDFATYEWTEIPPPEDYVELVKKEIRLRAPFVPEKTFDTIYFGGGTPSLIDASLIVAILDELAIQGFSISKHAEITIEINPATIDPNKIKIYQSAGINRYSVGAQTFNDQLLSAAGRKHSAQDTIQTLDLLRSHDLSYSFDLLFALPSQTLSMLKLDLNMVKNYSPNHLSAYCLTVPESHPMQKGRAPEEEQIEMFHLIESELAEIGLNLYEISNFAKPNHESRHNLLYWTDQSYWGVGLSAHSYFRDPDWGTRFWNPNTFNSYAKSLEKISNSKSNTQITDTYQAKHFEALERHQSLTDYCHVFLRLTQGLNLSDLEKKFSKKEAVVVSERLRILADKGLVIQENLSYQLSRQGRILSNQVFEALLFDEDSIF